MKTPLRLKLAVAGILVVWAVSGILWFRCVRRGGVFIPSIAACVAPADGLPVKVLRP